MSDNVALFIEIIKHRSVLFGDKGICKLIDIDKIDKDLSNSIDNVYLVDELKI